MTHPTVDASHDADLQNPLFFSTKSNMAAQPNLPEHDPSNEAMYFASIGDGDFEFLSVDMLQ